MKVTQQSSVFFRIVIVLFATLIIGIVMVGGASRSAKAQATNIALNKPVICSSSESTLYPCSAAVDGSTTTRWSSTFSDPQWIYVDLGSTYNITQVVLNWEAAYSSQYQVQISANASTWTNIYTTTAGNGGVDTLTVSGSGRYVRMNGTARGTAYGHSLWEFQVFGTPPSSQAPYGGTPWPIPGTVQAENYDTGGEGVAYHDSETANQGGVFRADGVDIEATTDAGGGNDVGWTAATEWLEYTVNVATSGSYTLSARTASMAGGGSMHVEIDGTNVTGAMSIPSTGGWQTWGTTTSSSFSLTAGQHVMRIAVDAAGFNLNWVSIQPTGSSQAPYGGSPWPVPGTVQAENYDTGGEGVAYHDNEAANQGATYRTDGVDIEVTSDTGGGNDVGWTAAGEWLEYTINAAGTQTYSVSARTASQAGGGSMHVEIDGVNVTGAMSVPSTGGWQTWSTITSPGFTLSGGQHIMRIAIDAAGFNLNWVSLQVGTPPQPVDFGPNVRIFDPSMSAATIQSSINSVYNAQQNNHFGDRRDAILFKPGTYNVDIGVGHYTEVLGLGATPDAVHITGNLHSDSFLSGNNSTQNFWRGVTNFSVSPNNGEVKWAVSQAIWFRNMHIRGNIALHQNGGWASGGWMSNSLIDGTVNSGPQQQWISRNTQWGNWTGSNWNMVFVGVVNAPAGNWPSPAYTKIATVPIVREKPFLMIDGAGNYSVRVPSLKSNSSGYDWAGGSVPGTTLPISDFFIAKPSDSAATINAQLASGKHLILTPGIYLLNDTIRVNRANTIVLGMGLATLRPTTGLAAMTVGDVDGVIIAGVLFDAGTTNSPVLLEVGTQGNNTSHAANPIVLHDVIFRVGGAAAGKATVSFRINANDTIVDHTWVWRADHGTGVCWTCNTGQNGVVVNGNNVTVYGLFVEHFQQFQTLWNGNGGRVYFYQSEIPYDPPNQSSWNSAAGTQGWASYKVANNVTSHEAWGLGIYSVFTNPNIFLSRAIEVPNNANVRFHNMITTCLGGNGGIIDVINNIGEQTGCNASFTPRVSNYP